MKNSNNYLADTTTESENKSKNKQTKNCDYMKQMRYCPVSSQKEFPELCSEKKCVL